MGYEPTVAGCEQSVKKFKCLVRVPNESEESEEQFQDFFLFQEREVQFGTMFQTRNFKFKKRLKRRESCSI